MLIIDGACFIALATAVGAAGSLRLAAGWAVCSLVVSVVVGLMLHVGHGRPQDVSASDEWDRLPRELSAAGVDRIEEPDT